MRPVSFYGGAMTRYRAGALHLLVSVVIAALVFAFVWLVWYPGVLLEATGAQWIVLVVGLVYFCVGPLVTAIVFKPGKRGLLFDLVAIGVLQTGALVCGLWVLHESRPAFIVFIQDRFELVRADDVEPGDLAKAKAPYDRLPEDGPRLVGAKLPRDPNEQFRLAMSAMQGGPDVQSFPQYFVPYAEVSKQALAKADRFAVLRKHNAQDVPAVDRLLADLAVPEERLRILPLRAGKRDLTAIVDAQSGDVLRIAAVRPWEFQ